MSTQVRQLLIKAGRQDAPFVFRSLVESFKKDVIYLDSLWKVKVEFIVYEKKQHLLIVQVKMSRPLRILFIMKLCSLEFMLAKIIFFDRNSYFRKKRAVIFACGFVSQNY